LNFQESAMKVYLIHHANALKAEQDPGRHLSETGREECARLGAHLKAAGASLARILHSDMQFSLESAERIAEALGQADRTALAGYPCNTGHDIAPFIAEIVASNGDIMMVGHSDFLVRTASKLLCGDETARVIEFKPGNATTFCIERDGDDWVLTYAWRPEHLAA
jgi:phosphohistidine phosphatase SixA